MSAVCTAATAAHQQAVPASQTQSISLKHGIITPKSQPLLTPYFKVIKVSLMLQITGLVGNEVPLMFFSADS